MKTIIVCALVLTGLSCLVSCNNNPKEGTWLTTPEEPMEQGDILVVNYSGKALSNGMDSVDIGYWHGSALDTFGLDGIGKVFKVR